MTTPRRLLIAAAVLMSLLVGLAVAELVARASGYRPRQKVVRPEPGIHDPDPVLGWRPRPGHYRFGPYTLWGAPVDVTVRPDGARDSGGGPANGRPALLLVGCSFTFGWALSDDQTWGARLQELRPDVAVENRGVGGYGTLQSLLVLEELLSRKQERPARVLYGFIDHGLRNVAAPMWMRMLALTEDTVATPYCTLGADGQRLERHPPEAAPSLPLHEHLSVVAMIENAWLQRSARARAGMAQQVTRLLVDEMAALCRAHGVEFSVVLLHVPPRFADVYVPYWRRRNIDVIDCNLQLGPGDSVPGEAHPNADVNRRWGDCIAAALAEPSRLSPP